MNVGFGPVLSLALITAGCARGEPRVVSPTTVKSPEPASAEGDPVEVTTLRQGESSSQHFVLLRGAETPHVHDRHDLTVFVLEGRVNMHFRDRIVEVVPGDVVDIPMGEFHWAENVSDSPSLAYIVFSPGFDGKDRRPVE